MAQTTVAINACDVAIFLDNASGTATDISGSSNKIEIPLTQEIGEARTFQNDYKIRKACGRDGAFNLTVIYTTGADEGLDILRDWYFSTGSKTARSIAVYVPDKNVGSDHYSAAVLLESLNIPLDPSEPGPVICEAALLPTGAISHTTAST